MNRTPVSWSCRDRPVSLQTLQIPPILRLVVLAPHPDDFDAIAVTLRFFQENGNPIDVAVVTSGASGVEHGFEGAFTPDAKAALREKEQRSSCRYFGLPEDRLTFLRLMEDSSGDPEDSAGNRERVSSYLEARRPDLVFLPHGNDPNPGHQRTYAFYREFVQDKKFPMAACLNRDPKTISMRDDLYMAFGAEMAAWKGSLLRIHQSQHQRNLHLRGYGFDERILRVNRRIAATLEREGEYAEAFELEEERFFAAKISRRQEF
jgi:LmbE family N-acetylglucosaminyl deacetylase